MHGVHDGEDGDVGGAVRMRSPRENVLTARTGFKTPVGESSWSDLGREPLQASVLLGRKPDA